jgi:hemerythrin-like domain-containing protein
MTVSTDTKSPSSTILVRLNRDHQHLACVLQVFEHQYRALETDDGPDYDLLRDILEYVRSFPDAIHHPTEDVLFNYLLQNASLADGEQAAIANNREQHAQLTEATKTLLLMIDHIFNIGIVDGAALKLTMSRYLSEQIRHMEFESTYLFPLAETRLTERDWRAIEDQIAEADDPMFDAYEKQFEFLRGYIETEFKPAA